MAAETSAHTGNKDEMDGVTERARERERERAGEREILNLTILSHDLAFMMPPLFQSLIDRLFHGARADYVWCQIRNIQCPTLSIYVVLFCFE